MKAKSTDSGNIPSSVEEKDEPFREPTEAEWADVDAWIERNKDALNASIEEAHAQFERGEYSTLGEVMARIRARRLSRAPKG